MGASPRPAAANELAQEVFPARCQVRAVCYRRQFVRRQSAITGRSRPSPFWQATNQFEVRRHRKNAAPPMPWKFSGGGPLSALQLLAVRWRGLSDTALTAYLRRLITRETQGRPSRGWREAINPPRRPHLQARLRRRRLEVAEVLSSRRVKVSRRVLAWALPPWHQWPGSVYLVGSRCDEDLPEPTV